MKKIIFIFLSAFLLNYSGLYSQSSDTTVQKKIKYISRWSLQFEVGYNFDIKSFKDLVFTTKYTFTPKAAIRFGAGVSINNEDVDYEINDPIQKIPSHTGNYDVKFMADFLYYPAPEAVIMFYFGIGPQAHFLYDYTESVQADLSKLVNDETKWGLGVNLTIGGEWFALSRLSFFAEYNISGVYQKGDAVSYRKSPENIISERVRSVSKGFVINPDDARIGISLYF